MKQKIRIIIYIAIAVTALALGIIAVLSIPKESAPQTADEFLNAGNKYLIELSYDKAVIEFNKAIEIEPRNADAYIGLAEAYLGMSEEDKAIETLELGYENTGDERIRERLEELLGEDEVVTTTVATTEVTTTEVVEEFITIKGEQYSSLEHHLTLRDVCEDDLIDLHKMVNLRYLSLYFSETSDISFLGESLSGLNMLEGLSISGDNIVDISFIEKLIGLKDLTLYTSNLSDISAIQNLTNLERLHLVLSEVTDINALKSLSKLKYLSFSCNIMSLTDISPIGNLTNLEDLSISCPNTHIYGNSPLSDISPLSNLKKLHTLHLNGLSINDISALSGLTQLTFLSLYENKISSMEPLSDLTNLTYLALSYNQLTNLYGIDKLTNLSSLHLRHNYITDITGIKNLTNLKYLDLDNSSWIDKQRNKINDISEIGYLTELVDLDFEVVDGVDISALSNLSKLESLHLGGNSTISDVTPLFQLTNLTRLVVAGRSVTNQDLELLKQNLPNCQVSR